MYVNVCTYMYALPADQERALHPREREFYKVVSYHMSAGNQT